MKNTDLLKDINSFKAVLSIIKKGSPNIALLPWELVIGLGLVSVIALFLSIFSINRSEYGDIKGRIKTEIESNIIARLKRLRYLESTGTGVKCREKKENEKISK